MPDVVLILPATGPTKRQIIVAAFGDLGMADYEFGRTAEEIADALSRLNALMGEWPWDAIGYVQPSYGVGDPEEASGIPFASLNAVSSALAPRIAAMMGATMGPEATGNMARSRALQFAQVATIPTMPRQSGTIAGAGSRGFGTFLRSPNVEETDPSDPGDLAGLLP